MTNLKDVDNEQPIPELWRYTFNRIVDALKNEDLIALHLIPNLNPVSREDFQRIQSNIHAYGTHLASLPEQTWSSSVCLYMGSNIWDVLIDLYTCEEGRSDLVLLARVSEYDGQFSFEIYDVHVP